MSHTWPLHASDAYSSHERRLLPSPLPLCLMYTEGKPPHLGCGAKRYLQAQPCPHSCTAWRSMPPVSATAGKGRASSTFQRILSTLTGELCMTFYRLSLLVPEYPLNRLPEGIKQLNRNNNDNESRRESTEKH